MPSSVASLLVISTSLAVVCLMILAAAIRVLPEYERAVVFRLGRLLGVKGPGIIFVLPALDRIIRVDVRQRTTRIPPFEVTTGDHGKFKASLVARYRVVDPETAVTTVENSTAETLLIAETALLREAASTNLDSLLEDRPRLNNRLLEVVTEQTAGWGIEVSSVELERADVLTYGRG